MPLCLGASGSVRARQIAQSASARLEVQTFCPLSSQPPSTFSARVRSDARSEPAPGSLNSWHQTISPRSVGRDEGLRCSSVPCARIVGSAHSPIGHRGCTMPARANSCAMTTCCGRAGVDPVRTRVVRRHETLLGRGMPAPLARAMTAASASISATQAPEARGLVFAARRSWRRCRARASPARCRCHVAARAEQRGQAHRPPPVQVDVVLPGVADPAEQSDRVQPDVDRAGQARCTAAAAAASANCSSGPARARRRRPRPRRTMSSTARRTSGRTCA